MAESDTTPKKQQLGSLDRLALRHNCIDYSIRVNSDNRSRSADDVISDAVKFEDFLKVA